MDRTPTNAEIARSLRQLADLLEIQGDPVFRVNAYRRAADNVEHLPEGLSAIRDRGELRRIPGVGAAIAEKIEDMLATGRLRQLDRLETEIPIGVADLLTVPDVGPKRANLLFRELGIDSLEALRIAVDEGKLAGLPGIGPKGAERIAAGLRSMVTDDRRLPLPLAVRLAADLIDRFRERAPSVTRIELAGSARRCRETVGDLDLVAAAEQPEAAVAAFAAMPDVARVEMRGTNRCRILLEGGVFADLRVLPERHWGNLLHHFTGGKAHNVRLRDLAIERGARQSEYGFQVGDRLITCATEAEVYAFFGMQYVPPPMREDTGEIELALAGTLPRVVGIDDLRGDVHAHSDWSDGGATVREMARAARARGYEYLCLTDHSVGLRIANGLSPDRLAAQRQEIDRVNAELAPFRVLQGLEVEVKADGSLDLPDDVLAGLDLLIASVHSGLRQDRARLTGRAVSALRHPLVDVLAHPTGRVLGGRSGGDYDLETLFAEAARTGTVLEINGPNLDLRDVHARAAVAAGCTLSLDSDAHSTAGLDDIHFAVGVAQRAWVPPDRILNTLGIEGMLPRLKRRTA